MAGRYTHEERIAIRENREYLARHKPYEMNPRINWWPIAAIVGVLLGILVGAMSGLPAMGQTRPTTTTAPASQPTTQATTGPQVVIILGYGTNDGLIQAVNNYWRPRLGATAKLYITVYDHSDVKGEIDAQFPTGDLRIVGFSHGGWRAIEVAKGYASPTTGPPRKIQRIVLLDPVPFPAPSKPGYVGFDLPDNVVGAWCTWRGYADQKTIFSGPIKSGKCEYDNYKYNPKANTDEAARHGEKVWDNLSVQQALK